MDSLLKKIHEDLGITSKHVARNKLSFQPQPELSKLKVIDIDFEGKPFILHTDVATAWIGMEAAAASEAISLRPFSGFRSYLHQKN